MYVDHLLKTTGYLKVRDQAVMRFIAVTIDHNTAEQLIKYVSSNQIILGNR